MEPLDRRLDQPHPAVVAVQPLVAEECVDAVEPGQVPVGRDDLEVRALPQFDTVAEVADDEAIVLPKYPSDGLPTSPARA